MSDLTDFTQGWCVDAEQLKRFKTRWEYTIFKYDRGAPCLDKGIVPTLRYLNSIEGVATVWSCESHAEDEALQTPHVILALTHEGILAIKEIWMSLVQKIDQYNKQHKKLFMIDWSICKLLDCTASDMPVDSSSKLVFYTAHNLAIHNLWPGDKKAALNLLHRAVVQYVQKKNREAIRRGEYPNVDQRHTRKQRTRAKA